MVSKKEGEISFYKFNIENFIQAPDDDFICSVCQNVFDDPKECPCGHLFCCKCINNWLKRKATCPICRAKVKSFDLKNVTYVLRNLIQKLKLKCPNAVNGCTIQPTVEKIDAHIHGCGYQNMSCKNMKCPNKSILRKDLKKHESGCTYRPVTCTKGCDFQIPKLEMKSHNCVKTLKEEITELRTAAAQMKESLKELTSKLKERDAELESYKSEMTRTTDWWPHSDNNLFDSFSDVSSSSSYATFLDFEESYDDYFSDQNFGDFYDSDEVIELRRPGRQSPAGDLSVISFISLDSDTQPNASHMTSNTNNEERRITRSHSRQNGNSTSASENPANKTYALRNVNSVSGSSAASRRSSVVSNSSDDTASYGSGHSILEKSSRNNANSRGGASESRTNSKSENSRKVGETSAHSRQANTTQNQPGASSSTKETNTANNAPSSSTGGRKRRVATTQGSCNTAPKSKHAKRSCTNGATEEVAKPSKTTRNNAKSKSTASSSVKTRGATYIAESDPSDESDSSCLSLSSDTSYEVKVPKSTWQLLEEYTSADDDSDASSSSSSSFF